MDDETVSRALMRRTSLRLIGASGPWKPATSGSVTSYAGGIVTSPVSPHDPSTSKRSLKVEVVSKGPPPPRVAT